MAIGNASFVRNRNWLAKNEQSMAGGPALN
jgi:hypothetical protein